MSGNKNRRDRRASTVRTTAAVGAALAAGAFGLHWLELQYAIRTFSTEYYVAFLAILFTGIGIWVGRQLSGSSEARPFERNEQVIETLGLTDKEIQVLRLVADGSSNQEIADRLFVSVSTIKTHIVNLHRKLDVSRRTQAVRKARSLQIIP